MGAYMVLSCLSEAYFIIVHNCSIVYNCLTLSTQILVERVNVNGRNARFKTAAGFFFKRTLAAFYVLHKNKEYILNHLILTNCVETMDK